MRALFFISSFFLIQFTCFSQSGKRKVEQIQKVSKYSITVDKNTKEVLESEVDEISNTKKTSFNTAYSQYLTSDAASKNYGALLIAYELDSTNSELYFELAKYYEITKNKTKKKEFCQKLNATKLSPALREYAYNTLMSVEKNAILVTYGEDDTYPIWILQTLENIRTDVKVVNYDLLINNSYRNQIVKSYGLKFSKRYSKNINILKDVAEKNSTKSIYYSLTVSHLVLKDLQKNLYSTGLALKYSKNKWDNLAVLKSNWETKFQKNYMLKPNNLENVKKMNVNYVLPLLQLSIYYGENNLPQKKAELNNVMRMLGRNAGKQKQIEALLAL